MSSARGVRGEGGYIEPGRAEVKRGEFLDEKGRVVVSKVRATVARNFKELEGIQKQLKELGYLDPNDLSKIDYSTVITPELGKINQKAAQWLSIRYNRITQETREIQKLIPSY